MFQIVRLMDEQQSINKKIANQIPVIVQKSVQEQSKSQNEKVSWASLAKRGNEANDNNDYAPFIQ